MHRVVSLHRARGLLGCAVCFLLLAQDAFGYTAEGPGGSIEPSISFDAGTASFGDDKPDKDVGSQDVVIFMQGITFPTEPTPGALFDIGQDPGAWGGIRKLHKDSGDPNKMWFQVNVGKAVGKSYPSYEPAEGEILWNTNTAAVVLTQNFPTDGEQHDVLVHITAPTDANGRKGSVRLFIDCEEKGIGYVDQFAGNRFWNSGDNGAYLGPTKGHGGNGATYHDAEGRTTWSGGSVDASPMHFYYDAATKFSPFTPYYFGCSNSCDAVQTASCDHNAACARDISAEPEIVTCTCRTGFDQTGNTCTDIDECTVPHSEAIAEAIARECSSASECSNSDGSFACVCPDGFTGNAYPSCWKLSVEAAGPGYNATTPTGNVAPSISFEPFSTMDRGPKEDVKNRAIDDVVLFMQNITFPSDPTLGYLFEFGGADQGLWAGINTNNQFEARIGNKANGYQSAGVVADVFPKDNLQHDVLIYATVGSGDSVHGSIRVFIDCEEVGAGFTLIGEIPSQKWANNDNNAYLLDPASNGGLGTGVGGWSGGAAGAGPMHIYFKSDPATASLFDPFTPYYFGCGESCPGPETASCDIFASANCSQGAPVSCACNPPFVVGDGSPGDCRLPYFTALTDAGLARPELKNYFEPGVVPTPNKQPEAPKKSYRAHDAIFYMQGITFSSVPSAGCLFHMGGNVGMWVGINGDNEFQAYIRKGRQTTQSMTISDFPKDGKKHTVLVYVSLGDEKTQGTLRVFIDCEEVLDMDFKSIGAWADGDSGSYLTVFTSGSPGGLPNTAWSGGTGGAGVLNFYSELSEPQLFDPFTPYYFGCGESCNGNETASCDRNADCARGNFSDVSELVGPDIWPEITCTCRTGFEGPGETCTDINECLIEAVTDQCHYMAECDNTNGSYACVCPVGFVGEGADECFGNAWAVRTVFNVPELAPDRRALTADRLDEIKLAYAQIISADPTLPMNSSLVSGMPVSFGAYRYGDSILEILEENADGKLTLMALMLNQTEAEATVARLTNASFNQDLWLAIGTVDDEPNVYRWVAQTTSAALEINPSGLQVDSVYFDPVCMSSGCWRVQITYTVGRDNLNVIFLPKAVGDDSLSYDFDYGDNDATWLVSPEDTFEPSEHPCGTLDYNPTAGSALPASVTACCIPQFLEMYRPVSTFEDALGAVDGLMANLSSACDPSGATAPVRNRAVNRAQVPIIARRGQDIDIAKNVFPRPTAPLADVPGLAADVFSDGVFSGMNESRINHTEVVDAYIGIYRAVLSLDEVELRRLGGQLRGTVGVEHTVDTFIGKLEFSMTGIQFLDPFATQVAIHLEKTSFFSVSTHGVNDYTFLEYVNMRLVTILWEDRNFAGVSTGTGVSGDANGDDEATSRSVRTNTTDNVNYVQVTFTLGSKYTVNNNPNSDEFESGLIPLDSVRVGRGTFFDTTTMEHVCQEYADAADDEDVGLTVGRVVKEDFDDAVDQPCGPASSMCASPSSIPDQFVSFNIPLGKEIFDGQASNDLSNNIFVDFVVNALDPTASGTPNNGDDPRQMKTTLTASIPIVAGGVNIFCDGITAKTDLKDVANADIVVGTASNETELTRLRIVERVASTDLAAVPSTQIDTASIESALMTLVLLGNESYFKTGATNTGGYSLELDDLITLHLMEDGDAGTVGADGVSTNTKENAVIALLNEPADDNSDTNGLDTDGYKLNGAFRFDIARAQGIAKLEPTTELLAICPFNPPRPQPGNGELETCITRRDVRSREYPARTGSPFPTAMEIFNSEVMDDEPTSKTVNTWDLATEEAALARQVVSPGSKPCPGSGVADYNGDYSKATFADSGYACEAGFMTSILGDSVYSRQLAKDFVAAIRTRYDLNGRYTRAFWINPGYEWTPTQTAGASLFQVSQKIYLFALVTLDENWSRRRMLLQADTDPTANSGSGTGGAKVEFPVTPKSMLASSFNVPEDKVALFEVELQLTPTEACMSTSELQDSIRLTMDDYLTGAASSFWTAQITRINVKKGDEDCSSRRGAIRSLLSGFSSATATVQMLVVFKEGEEAVFNEEAFAAMAGVNTVISLNNAGQVTIDNTFKCEGSNCGAIGAGAGAGPGASSSSSSSDKTTLIAGVCGGVGGALVVGAAVALWMRSRKPDELVMATPVQTIDVTSLKAQLQEEV